MKKRIVSTVLLMIMLAGLLVGCTPSNTEDNGLIPTGYTLDEADVETLFFMDRDYVLDASQVNTNAKELQKAGDWLNKYILNSINSKELAFDFNIGDEKFSEIFSTWTLNTETTSDNEVQTDYLLTYTKEGQPLEVRVNASAYKEYAVIEWTVWIENVGDEDSAQINELLGLSEKFALDNGENPVELTMFEGGKESANSFKAQHRVLAVGKERELVALGGKPTVTWTPYINLQWENSDAAWGKEGVFISTGWSGQWRINIVNEGGGVTVQARQQELDAYLKPGEKVRSPLMALLFWEKDFMRSQNLWRRWVYNVAMPQPYDEPVETLRFSISAGVTTLTMDATTKNQLEYIQWYLDSGLDIDAWQMDAGWYNMPNITDPTAHSNWVQTGNWYADPARFGENLSAIGDALDAAGMKFILWYEPERLVYGSDWAKQFKDSDYIVETGSHYLLFNLSSDDATDFLIDYMISSLNEHGVDIYRQDCNINTAPSLMDFWRSLNTDGRTGLAENKYIVNYLRYYDAILEAFPDSFIDSCASGGKRLDLETIKRSVAMWRDDSCYIPEIEQSQSWGINFFIPYSGKAVMEENPGKMAYAFRSEMYPSTGYVLRLDKNMNNAQQMARYEQFIGEHEAYANYMTADYYPLTAFSDEDTAWMAWQFNDYKTTSGIVQVFKRSESPLDEETYYLSGLELDTTYKITDIDTGDFVEATGKQLMQNGITVTITAKFAAKIFHYEPMT